MKTNKTDPGQDNEDIYFHKIPKRIIVLRKQCMHTLRRDVGKHLFLHPCCDVQAYFNIIMLPFSKIHHLFYYKHHNIPYIFTL